MQIKHKFGKLLHLTDFTCNKTKLYLQVNLIVNLPQPEVKQYFKLSN